MLEVFNVYRGTVRSLRDFGAFVSFKESSMEGLLHISQLSKYKIDKVSDVVAVGDVIYCKVISLEVFILWFVYWLGQEDVSVHQVYSTT